jgi:predicted nucleotidyltransferase
MGKYLYLVTEQRKKEQERRQKLRENLLENIKGALLELAKIVSFKDAYIFGSVTNTKTFSPFSDIDIAFYGLKEENFFKTMAFLSRYLERDVDVIQLENHKLEKKIINEGIKWNG